MAQIFLRLSRRAQRLWRQGARYPWPPRHSDGQRASGDYQ
jgi:hypothetical protein